ncbi:Ubiquitin-conjugating enzyme E2 [Fulvia fulva]|nr:Ubiquitin-conjugating enzyme E2 [Fulvia fulva]KAK4620308.1 Ubiquitin-conjugating enzyme E2 [Fulvia fulva]WPV17481.1 Ubiquitin-conjugating enzyme E2 [Fulvia fulva]WPV32009.1 Ubiquitin-conjugating enzyme E2 [Fulvia fulva]
MQHPQLKSERDCLEKDLLESEKSGSMKGITLKPVPRTRLRQWTATVEITEADYPESAYQGGSFNFTIVIKDEKLTYPFKALEITCNTKLYSPHINAQTGKVISKLDDQYWSPALDLRAMMSAFVESMMQPVPAYAAGEEIGREYKNERIEFTKKAKEWTRLYAME